MLFTSEKYIFPSEKSEGNP